MVLSIAIDPYMVDGLGRSEAAVLTELLDVYSWHKQKNEEKDRYYEGHIPLSEVNLGLALPEGMRKLEIGCSWGAKAVDVLAARSMFDGFVDSNGAEVEQLAEIVSGNRLIAEYAKACRDELKFGCTFATLSADPVTSCKIRFHSPQSAAAVWNGEQGRIGAGFAVIDSVPDESLAGTWTPSIINLYVDDAIWVLTKMGSGWAAIRHPHRMGRPLMEPMIWNATSNKPFGQSRLKSSIRSKIQSYVRTVANATIGLEFATTPQKYLLGITDAQYDALIDAKFKQYVGSVLLGTTNPETGEKPSFGQLPQGSITPHIEMMRLLATQFSADTGLPVTDTGVVNDANPSSSDAIEAQTKTLVGLAQDLNVANGDALRVIALMAQAIAAKSTIDELPDSQKGIVAHFKNPAMPSVAVTADAAIKIASVRPEFAQTDVFMEMIGFDQADIRRIKAQERRARGMQLITEEAAAPEEQPEQTAQEQPEQIQQE